MHPYLAFLQQFSLWLEFQDDSLIIWPATLDCEHYLKQLNYDIYQAIDNSDYHNSLMKKPYSKPNLIKLLSFLMSFIRPLTLKLEEYLFLSHLILGKPEEQQPQSQSDYLFMLPLWSNNPYQIEINQFLVEKTEHFEIAYLGAFAKKINYQKSSESDNTSINSEDRADTLHQYVSLSFDKKICFLKKISQHLFSFKENQIQAVYLDNPQFLYYLHLFFPDFNEYGNALTLLEQLNTYYITTSLDRGHFIEENTDIEYDKRCNKWHLEISSTQFYANYCWFEPDFYFTLIITAIVDVLKENIKILAISHIDYVIETDACHLLFYLPDNSDSFLLSSDEITDLFYILVERFVQNYSHLNSFDTSFLHRDLLQFLLEKSLISSYENHDTMELISKI
jgi:hypothetical protein